MTETKFTPGPWYAAQPEDCGGWWIVAVDKEGCDPIDSGDGGFEKGDAHLIAAAPDLYEALYSLTMTASRYLPEYNENPLIQDAEASLAKARGEE